MPAILTLDELGDTVSEYLKHDEFVFDVETLPRDLTAPSNWRGDPLRNQVVWLSLATQGRADAIPLGHPNGELLSTEFPLTVVGERRVEDNKQRLLGNRLTKSGKRMEPLELLPSHYSHNEANLIRHFSPAPKQLQWGPKVRGILEPLFFSDRLKIAHNAPFDIKSIAKHFGGVMPPPPYCDTQITGFILDMRNKGFLDLGTCCSRELGYEMKKGIGKQIEIHGFKETAKYAYLDAKEEWLLWKWYEKQVEALGLEGLWSLEMDVLDVVVQMEMTGAPIKMDRLEELDAWLRTRLEDTTADVYRQAGRPFNLSSNQELSQVLFSPKTDGGQGMRPKVLTEGGKKAKAAGEEVQFKHYSVSEDALKALAGTKPIIDSIIEFGELKKLHGGFVLPYLGGDNERTTNGKTVTEHRESMLINGRIHATFNQTGAQTGRFSSKKPNLQNVPARSEDGKKIRACFSTEDMDGWCIVQSDYSQIEPRILTDLSEEPALLKVYLEGGDIYTALADPFGIPRSGGKILFLSVAYGTGPETLATAVGIKISEAKTIIYEDFPKKFPAITVAKKRVMQEAKRRSPAHIRTLLGRRLYLPDLRSPIEGLRRRAERQAFNAVIQGSAADIMKVGLVRTHRNVQPLGGKIFATIHDEVLVLAPKDRADEIAAAVQESLEGVSVLHKVPLIAETHIVDNWAEAK